MRRKIIAGNWKMFKTPTEAAIMVKALRPLVQGIKAEIIICPPFPALDRVFAGIIGSNLILGAQNVYWEQEGAFTGEVSPVMLRDLGCRYVIIGHSERRQFFFEDDAAVNRKVGAVFENGMIPILCVGETLEQREGGKTEEHCRRQLERGVAGISPEKAATLVVAYEPIWAIGTGRNALPGDAQQVISSLRHTLAGLYGEVVAGSVRMLYGGSVKPENAGGFLGQDDIDGALVGGASLDAESFAALLREGDA